MKFKADPTKLYSCDNGMILCGTHLGSTARASGRDISGQRIAVITEDDRAEFAAIVGRDPACETCK